MSTPTLSSLQLALTALSVRVGVLDGQGLVSPAIGFMQQSTANIAGMKNDIDGTALELEALVNSLTAQVQALQTSVNTLLGLSGLEVPPGWVTPPISMGAKASPIKTPPIKTPPVT